MLIVDNRAESLITMDAGADDDSQRCVPCTRRSRLLPLAPDATAHGSDEALIPVPCALVTQAVGEALKARILLGRRRAALRARGRLGVLDQQQR